MCKYSNRIYRFDLDVTALFDRVLYWPFDLELEFFLAIAVSLGVFRGGPLESVTFSLILNALVNFQYISDNSFIFSYFKSHDNTFDKKLTSGNSSLLYLSWL